MYIIKSAKPRRVIVTALDAAALDDSDLIGGRPRLNRTIGVLLLLLARFAEVMDKEVLDKEVHHTETRSLIDSRDSLAHYSTRQ
jgi:hypothetical protein